MAQEISQRMTAADVRAGYLNQGMSRRQFATSIGVAEGTIRRLELGEQIRPATAKRIADFFGCKVTDLLSESAA